jgi:hypothetical protein
MALIEMLTAAAEGAAEKEADDLTNLEKVALAYAAGLAYRTTWTDEGKMRVDIVDPFGIVKIDGKFIVAHRAAERGDRISVRLDHLNGEDHGNV